MIYLRPVTSLRPRVRRIRKRRWPNFLCTCATAVILAACFYAILILLGGYAR